MQLTRRACECRLNAVDGDGHGDPYLSPSKHTRMAPLERGRGSADALTTAERRVAELAADGMTNREIAQTLFVTVKTVEWHLRNTYGKLGIGCRQELRGLALGRRPAAA